MLLVDVLSSVTTKYFLYGGDQAVALRWVYISRSVSFYSQVLGPKALNDFNVIYPCVAAKLNSVEPNQF